MKHWLLRGAILSLVFAGFPILAVADDDDNNFNNRDLKGSYIYSFQGPTSLGNISEIGIFTANGKSPVGKITAVAHTFLGGGEVAAPNTPVWDCDYSVASNGFVDITCTRVDFNVPNIKWSMVIDRNKKNVRFQAGDNQPGCGAVDIQGSGPHH